MKLEILEFEKLEYIIRYPDGYRKGEKYPILIFLHGAGTRGADIEILKNHVFFKEIDKHINFPFIVVAPHCKENMWYDVYERLKRLVLNIATSDFADEARIYLMGASMGAFGSWQLAMSLPELFAAVIPISGGGLKWSASRLINVPIWAFHGGKDTLVEPEESIKMVDAVNKCGGNAKLTIYPENGHDAWTATWRNYKVFEWLLSNVNSNTSVIKEIYNNSETFG